MSNDQKKEQTNATALETVSAKFVSQIERQFVAEMGSALAFTEYEKTLAQHMYVKIDATLKALEDKRGQKQDVVPYKWENVNLPKLALDAVHRIGLGLDALIPNHIHPIPYLNGKTKKYDLDLRIGYVGKDYCRRKLAVEEPLEVLYHLVHDTDIFKPHMKSLKNEVESFEFEIANPFNRGKVVGGFGYIMYEDPKKNKLIMVTERDFKKAEGGARTKDFWSEDKWREEMMYKTIVHRVSEKLSLDPKKVNAKSYAYVEAQENDERAQQEVDQNANKTTIDVKGEILDESEHGQPDPAASGQPKQDIPKDPPAQGQPEQMSLGATGTDGPGF
ncbi:MAG: recombinase RecT [Dehalobacter sp.]|nr:recombinase RecT [Dehalobacter sp.]